MKSSQKIFAGILSAAALATATIIGLSGNDQSKIYISSLGDDSNPGTLEQPIKTIAKLNTLTLDKIDTVFFTSGQQFYGTLVPKAGKVYAAYGNGKSQITGLTKITGWHSVGTNLWESDVIENVKLPLDVVVKDGELLENGRYPNSGSANDGWMKITSHSGSSSVTANELKLSDLTGANAVIRNGRWKIDNVKVVGQAGQTLTLKNLDGTSATVSLLDGYGVFVRNHPATLDKKNEWYFNTSTKKLLMFSDVEPSNVSVSTLDNLVSINGKGHIKFQGLEFTGADKEAVWLDGTGVGNSFENVSWKNNYIGLWAKAGQDSVLIKNSRFLNHLENAITTSGPHATVFHSAIVKSGYLQGMGGSGEHRYLGIKIMGNNSTVEKCFIDSTGYIGIYCFGDYTKIVSNLVKNSCLWKDDGASIYTYMGGTSAGIAKGRIIAYNVIIGGKDALGGTNSPTVGSYGIYMDNKTNGVKIYKNTLINTGYSGIFLNNNFNIEVAENTIANDLWNGTGILINNMKPAEQPVSGLNIHENKVRLATRPYLEIRSAVSDISKFGTIDNNIAYHDVLGKLQVKVAVSNVPGVYYTMDQWKKLAYDHNTVEKTGAPELLQFPDGTRDLVYPVIDSVVVVPPVDTVVTPIDTVPKPVDTPEAPIDTVKLPVDTVKSVPAVNIVPSIAFRQPTQLTFTAPAKIVFEVAATDADGKIDNVTFHKDSTLIQIERLRPYSDTLYNVPAGAFTVTAKATDNKGATASASINITVKAAVTTKPTTIQVENLTVKENLYIKVYTAKPQTLRVRIYSGRGTLVRDKSFSVATGSSVVTMPTKSLNPGAYKALISFPDKQLTVGIAR